MKYIKHFVMSLAYFLIFSSNSHGSSINSDNCFSYIVMDSKTGQVISEKNSHAQSAPASTTKVMTSIVALENGDLDRKLVASFSAVHDIGKDGMNIGIVPGEELSLREILHCLLIRSANETANMISENLAPTKNDFMNYLNKRAKELGAKNTFFVNPSGKDSEASDINHLSTAYDLAIMAKHAMTFPLFREIVSQRMFTIPPTNKLDKPRYLASTNKLLGASYSSPHYSKVTGIKTGFTSNAGSTLISSAVDKEGNELIVVILGYKNGVIFQFAKELLEYGFKDFTYTTLVEKNSFQKNSFLPEYPDQKIQLIADKRLRVILPKSPELKWNIDKKEYLNITQNKQIKIGDKLGQVEYFVNGTTVGIVNLVSNTTITTTKTYRNYFESIDFNKILKSLAYPLIGTFLALAFLSLFILCFKKLRKLKRKKKKFKTKHSHNLEHTHSDKNKHEHKHSDKHKNKHADKHKHSDKHNHENKNKQEHNFKYFKKYNYSKDT